MSDSIRVEFKTLDQTTLRGDFFQAPGTARPVIVMTQDLSLLKEHYIDDTARRFQSAGISALVYDHRSYGSSDGLPRHETDPMRQAEDYHDAVSAAMTLPGVDPQRVAVWGIGHSGGAVMIGAGDDPRTKAVILNMPFTSGVRDAKAFHPGLLDRAWAEREARVRVPATEPDYVRLWPNSLANARGETGEGSFLSGEVPWKFISGALARSQAAGTAWENRLSLQSFYYLSKAEPQNFFWKIAPRALLYLATEDDPLTRRLEAPREIFNGAGANAEFDVLTPDHLGTYFGDAFERAIAVQLDFLRRSL